MLQNNTNSDPIVEILRLAYRRGLAIQREREGKNKTIIPQSLRSDLSTIEQEQPIEAKDVRAEVGK